MTRKQESDSVESKPISIGALSRATRIPVETLRTWERRYGSPVPVRKPSGHRVYPAASVQQLRRVARLLSQGHRPGEILGLPVRELDSMLSLSEPSAPRSRPSAESAPVSEAALERSLGEMIRAATDLDREPLLRELRANWVRLGLLRFLRECAGAFMTEVGAAWSNGKLEVRHEHFASGCLSDFLREVREPYDHEARGPRVVVAGLPGEAHEGGLLMVSLLLAARGCHVVYLGPDTPIEQIAAAARGGGVEAVALSVSAATPRARAASALALLRGRLPRRMPLWLGGAGAPKPPEGVELFHDLEALDARLSARS
jgi:methanogenic corrinoid protein MtbC1